MLNERFGYTMDPAEAVEHKESLYLSMLSEVQPIGSVVAHIKAQHERIPFAVISGSARESNSEDLDHSWAAELLSGDRRAQRITRMGSRIRSHF